MSERDPERPAEMIAEAMLERIHDEEGVWITVNPVELEIVLEAFLEKGRQEREPDAELEALLAKIERRFAPIRELPDGDEPEPGEPEG